MSISRFTVKNRIPIYAFLELTRHCNLSCSHCYIVKENRPQLPADKIKDIIDQLKEHHCLILNFSGGEVFTRRDFFEIARYARKQKFAVKIFTNGTLIGEREAKILSELKPIRVEVTIFSTEPKIHDSITGVGGSLGKSLQALELLRAGKINVRIKSPLLQQNAPGYKSIIKLAERLGAKYQFDPGIMPKTDGSQSPVYLRVGRKDLTEIFRDPRIISGSDRLKVAHGNVPCSAGHNSCAISAYGDVFPCVALPIKLGSLYEKNFSEIWRNSRDLSRLRSIKSKDLAKCVTCGLKSYCTRCPGFAYLEDGDILGPSSRSCFCARAYKDALSEKAGS